MWNSCLFISTLSFAMSHTDGYSTLNIVQEDKQQTYFQSQQEGQNSLEMCFSLLRVSSPWLWTTCANPQQFLQWCPERRVPQHSKNLPAMPPKCSRPLHMYSTLQHSASQVWDYRQGDRVFSSVFSVKNAPQRFSFSHSAPGEYTFPVLEIETVHPAVPYCSVRTT